MDGVQAAVVRNKELEAACRRDVNELLLKYLNGSTTIAELEMIGDQVFSVIDKWNRKGGVLTLER